MANKKKKEEELAKKGEKVEKIDLSFIAFDPSDIETLPDKVPNTNVGIYVPYGQDNIYPDYLNVLYQNSGIFASIINSICDYVGGSAITFSPVVLSRLHFNRESELRNLVKRVIFDRVLTGGFALKVVYNLNKEIAKIEWKDIRDIRLSVNCERAYYALNFGRGRRGELEVYSTMDHFTPGDDPHNHYTCIYYNRGRSRGVYPVPSYQGALRAIQTDCEINKFNLHAIAGGLSAASVINIPNGDSYTEDEKRMIERKFRENFTGSDNADSFILSFNPSSEDKVQIEKIEDDTFAEKYDTLSKSNVKNIFTAFRMSPVLAGYLEQ